VDVPPIQVNIDCLILERFADVTMDWETTIKIDNLLGESITFGGKTDPSTGELLPNFPGASLRESRRSDFGLDIGFWKNQGIVGHEFRALVDLLISKGYLKILMNPAIETINGRRAVIVSKDYAPVDKIVTPPGVQPYSLTEYQWVEDTLEVTPHVYSDGSIGLATTIKLGSRSKPEGVVQTSIITERSIEVDENRIRPGESLVIGGIRKSEERAVIRGVPFFKDIPVFGILFSSKDYEEKATEVIFILTPSISSGGIMHTDMVEDVRDKFRRPRYEYGLRKVLTDPLGTNAYTDMVEQEAADAWVEGAGDN
jgi:type II secretory pathway component GspD/PulD (secretin)